MSEFTDTQRLDFMLCKFRKVVVEVLPFGGRDIYVEEGFMGNKTYGAVRLTSPSAQEEDQAKRMAIDIALQGQP
ncbi:hypothetical protein N5D52_29075 [Pseudomonas sp. GD03860]|uniref:hypothetical protein n=1 Tax=Pseudomonas TaxID=286 RepID=UPI00236493FD|nr:MULTISPECIES: hypothetical protein [Pseudomonas]MDD2056562.1 hypothetical protein [Pseudomonas putida]MDH0640981.1 hypothetical protein [Pseudomonas sp. GD03860]